MESEDTPKSNLDPKQVLTIELYAEQVKRGSKYMADIGIWDSSDLQDVLGEIVYYVEQSELQIFIQEYEDEGQEYSVIYIYKYPWVGDLLKFLTVDFPENENSEVAFHVICGLVYGYGPSEIEEFVTKQRVISRGRKIVQGAVKIDGDIE